MKRDEFKSLASESAGGTCGRRASDRRARIVARAPAGRVRRAAVRGQRRPLPRAVSRRGRWRQRRRCSGRFRLGGRALARETAAGRETNPTEIARTDVAPPAIAPRRSRRRRPPRRSAIEAGCAFERKPRRVLACWPASRRRFGGRRTNRAIRVNPLRHAAALGLIRDEDPSELVRAEVTFGENGVARSIRLLNEAKTKMKLSLRNRAFVLCRRRAFKDRRGEPRPDRRIPSSCAFGKKSSRAPSRPRPSRKARRRWPTARG